MWFEEGTFVAWGLLRRLSYILIKEVTFLNVDYIGNFIEFRLRRGLSYILIKEVIFLHVII